MSPNGFSNTQSCESEVGCRSPPRCSVNDRFRRDQEPAQTNPATGAAGTDVVGGVKTRRGTEPPRIHARQVSEVSAQSATAARAGEFTHRVVDDGRPAPGSLAVADAVGVLFATVAGNRAVVAVGITIRDLDAAHVGIHPVADMVISCRRTTPAANGLTGIVTCFQSHIHISHVERLGPPCLPGEADHAHRRGYQRRMPPSMATFAYRLFANQRRTGAPSTASLVAKSTDLERNSRATPHRKQPTPPPTTPAHR